MNERLALPIPNQRSPGYNARVPVRDAAVLIVIRYDPDVPRVLMGRRHGSHAFMPNRVVFPGGRVDRADYAFAHGGALPQTTEQLLLERIHGNRSTRRAKSFALAAIREAYEETGILIGRSVERRPATRSASWRAYLEHRVVPEVSHLHFIARAITPPGMVRRFDTRFFIADAQRIAASAPPPTTELVAPSWLTFDEARAEPLPSVTRIILDIAEMRLDDLATGRIYGARPFFHVRRGRRMTDMLGLAT